MHEVNKKEKSKSIYLQTIQKVRQDIFNEALEELKSYLKSLKVSSVNKVFLVANQKHSTMDNHEDET